MKSLLTLINETLFSLLSAPTGRVVNGQEAAPHQFPWLVAVKCLGSDEEITNNDGNGWSCTGSLITESHVLTAGHCVYGCNGGFELAVGAHNRNDVQNDPYASIVEVEPTDGLQYNSPEYRPLGFRNDVAIIPLPEPVTLNENIQLSCLPKRRGSQDIDYLAGELATITGWGKTSDEAATGPDVPHFARDRPIIANRACAPFYTGVYIVDSVICTSGSGDEPGEGIGICFGDSGGPLNLQTEEFGKYIQVGVTSFLSPLGCESGVPQGFSRVTENLDFIAERTGLDL